MRAQESRCKNLSSSCHFQQGLRSGWYISMLAQLRVVFMAK